MASSSVLPALVVVLSLLTGNVHCQVPQDCTVTASQTMSGFRDMTCYCMHSLPKNVQNIDQLKYDLGDCENLTALDISWQDLEQGIGPRAVTFIDAEIIILPHSRQAWNSTLQKIEFELCLFNSVPPRAFEGLNMLSELRFTNSYIGKVDPYAISNLGNLTTLEISDSDVDEITANAISGLPNIFTVRLERSNIKMMRQGAIHNLRIPQLPVDQSCPGIDIRFGSDQDETAIGEIMGRSLESTDNLPLPEFGARLLIYRCNFTTIEREAVESDLFAFLILGGNQVSYLGGSAFKVELSNQCEISALMIVGNVFESIQPGAFAFANGKLGATHKTFFVLTNNTFEYVAEAGFFLSSPIEIFTVKDNKFVCNCSFFEWIMGEPATKRQQELERDLLMNGKCAHQNLGAANFTSVCRDEPITVSLPDGATGMTHMHLSSSASLGRISWLLGLAAVGFVMCLV